MKNDPNWYYKHPSFEKQAKDADLVYKRLEKSGWIEKFRKGWNLPPEGCSNNANFQKWYRLFVTEPSNKVLNKDFFKKMQKELRKKKLGWVNGKASLPEIEHYEFEMSKRVPDFKFDYDIQSIMTELKIPQYFELLVHDRLVYKECPEGYPLEKDLPKLDFSYDPNTRRKRLFVEIFADTKIKDFSEAVFQMKLKESQEKLYDYGTITQLGTKNTQQVDEIYRMHHIEGKSVKQIQNELGVRNVATILKRYKRKLALGTRKKQK